MSTEALHAYTESLSAGPFPAHPDPYAEAGQWFHQIHEGLIGALLEQLQSQLLPRGYVASREASLQIAEGRRPDLSIQALHQRPPLPYNYQAQAERLQSAISLALDDDPPDLDALYLWEGHELVTVVEVVSPRNKLSPAEVAAYRQRRDRLFLSQGVHVVEIDLTRSRERLLEHPLAHRWPYHVALFVVNDRRQFIGLSYGQSLPRLALPLRREAVAVELQAAYERAYRQAAIAAQLELRQGYASLPELGLSEEERSQAQAQAQAWLAQVAHLRQLAWPTPPLSAP